MISYLPVPKREVQVDENGFGNLFEDVSRDVDDAGCPWPGSLFLLSYYTINEFEFQVVW
jgi:hypothetical protein